MSNPSALNLQSASPSPRGRFFHARLMWREGLASGPHGVLFLLCVVLAMVSLVAERGLSGSIDRALRQDARSLLAGDIIVHSHQPISAPLRQEVERLVREGRVEAAAIHTFYSMARAGTEAGAETETETAGEALLAQIKAVEPGYPFYGTVELASGRPFREQLQPGAAVVEQSLLDRLGLEIGDSIRLGEAFLTVSDVVVGEPDRPVDFFSLGPRIFVAGADLASLGLIEKGSRVTYDLLLKVHREKELAPLADRLTGLAEPGRERVSTYRTAGSRMQRYYDNFLFFLGLIAIFTLLLAGIAMERAVTALLRDRTRTIAILRTLGASGPFILINYLALVLLLGLAGSLLGLGLGIALQKILLDLGGSMLPPAATLYLSRADVLRALATGLTVVALFSLLPLARLRNVRPMTVFSGQTMAGSRRGPVTFFLIAIPAFFSGLVLLTVDKPRTGMMFIAGTLALILACFLLARLVLFGLGRLHPRDLSLRRAVRGLFRPGNATAAILTTLSASGVLLFTMVLVEENLSAMFVDSFPAEAPNLYFIDIQPSQLDEFKVLLNIEAHYYPVVRGRVEAVNGVTVDRQAEQMKRGDNLGREFSLTWRPTLLADETIEQGAALFNSNIEGPQVSILDYMAENSDIRMGDRLGFNIQGLPLIATVSSIRGRLERPLTPFFVFVFPEEVLGRAPQTYFTGVRVAPELVTELRNRVVSRFANISVVDMGATVKTIADVLHNLLIVIRFLALFGILAGVLLIASSIAATRVERLQEAVYFKIVGATRGFVQRMFFLENLLIGLSGGAIALLLAQIVSRLICRRELKIPYEPFLGRSAAMVAALVVLTTATGWLASRRILREKPVNYLQRLE